MLELNSVALYPIIAMLWQCFENCAGFASLTLAVGDNGFRRKSSYLFACGKAFLCQTNTVITTFVESGALLSLRVFCNSIKKISLLKNVAGNFGVHPGDQFPSEQTYL